MRSVLLATLVVFMLAGCAANDAQQPPGDNISVPGSCASWDESWCEPLESGVHAHNLSLAPVRGAGLTIVAGPTIHISNVTVMGGEAGLVVNPIDCPCTVKIVDVHIASDGEAGIIVSPVGVETAAVDVELTRVLVAGPSTAIDIVQSSASRLADISISNVETGVRVHSTSTLTLQGASIQGASDKGLCLEGVDRFIAQDLTIEAAATGILSPSGAYGELVDLHLTGNNLGIDWRGGHLQGTRWHVSQNGNADNVAEATGGVQISLATAQVDNSHFEGNLPSAVSAGPGTVEFTRNWWGSPEGARLMAHPDLPPLGAGGDAVTKEVDASEHLRSPP